MHHRLIDVSRHKISWQAEGRCYAQRVQCFDGIPVLFLLSVGRKAVPASARRGYVPANFKFSFFTGRRYP